MANTTPPLQSSELIIKTADQPSSPTGTSLEFTDDSFKEAIKNEEVVRENAGVQRENKDQLTNGPILTVGDDFHLNHKEETTPLHTDDISVVRSKDLRVHATLNTFPFSLATNVIHYSEKAARQDPVNTNFAIQDNHRPTVLPPRDSSSELSGNPSKKILSQRDASHSTYASPRNELSSFDHIEKTSPTERISECEKTKESQSLSSHLSFPNCSNSSNSRIRDVASNVSSQSSHHSFPTRSPTVTSPQILEQHISKIISENAVIVETLDPLWSKRYLRQTSISSCSGVEKELKRTTPNANIKLRRFSEDLGASKKLYQDSFNKSKLHNPSRARVPEVHRKPLTPPITTSYQNNLACEASKDIAHQNSPSNVSTPFDNPSQNAQRHPQNPEGSIIKDLLLKYRGSLKSTGDSPEEEILHGIPSSKRQRVDLEIPLKSEVAAYTCSKCNTQFNTLHLFETHHQQCYQVVLPSGKNKLHPDSDRNFNFKKTISDIACLEDGHLVKRTKFSEQISDIEDSNYAENHIAENSISSPFPFSSEGDIITFQIGGENLALGNTLKDPPGVIETIAKPDLQSGGTIIQLNITRPLSSADHAPSVIIEPNSSLHQTVFPSSPSESLNTQSSIIDNFVPEDCCDPSGVSSKTVALRPDNLTLESHSESKTSNSSNLLESPDTPRSKKSCHQTYIDGHAYTYLGLKSSTRPTFCCLFRPQPSFLQVEGSRLSMYSNWQVVASKPDPSGLTAGQLLAFYRSPSRHRRSRLIYVTAVSKEEPLFTHSSYWSYRSQQDVPSSTEDFDIKQNSDPNRLTHFDQVESPALATPEQNPDENSNEKVEDKPADEEEEMTQSAGKETSDPSHHVRAVFDGGGTSNGAPPERPSGGEGTDYTYVRGRGRGRYVCEECGIRCKKPSMLKKHIRTHTDLRPYACRHCAFAFKTKGNLTKHMKSKAHHKKCVELGIVPVPTVVDDSQIDGDALAKQEKLELLNKQQTSDDEEDEDDDSDDDDDPDSDGLVMEDSRTTADTRSPPVAPTSAEDGEDKLIISSPPPDPDPPSQREEEQEAAESLLHLSAVSPEATSLNHSDVTGFTRSDLSSPVSFAWSSPPRQRSYSMETSSSHLKRPSFLEDLEEVMEGYKVPRRYSISATREAWMNVAHKGMVEEQPMDLSMSRCTEPLVNMPPEYSVIRTSVQSKHLLSYDLPTCTTPSYTSSISSPPYLPEDILNPSIFEENELSELHVTMYSTPITPITPEEVLPHFFQQGQKLKDLEQHPNPENKNIVKSNKPTVSTAGKAGGKSHTEEGKCVCNICNKGFAKLSQLRLHVNIHYFERPFKCESCAVSFRTKGHLQKHKRSVSHFNKVNMNITFGTPSVDNPRPFKCEDCKIAFRIHGHLAKHLRSKLHIMKLECLGKLPFGIYAEMEKSGTNLNEIDTTDCDTAMRTLREIAQALYQKNPKRLRWQGGEAPQTTAEKTSPLQSALVPGGVLHLAPSTKADSSSGLPSAGSSGASSGTLQEEGRKSDSLLQRSCTCSLCGRLFKSTKFLQIHLYCDHTQTQSINVDARVQQEQSASSYMCHECGSTFVQALDLQRHLQSHVVINS